MANARAHAEAAAELIGAHVTGVISVDDTAGQIRGRSTTMGCEQRRPTVSRLFRPSTGSSR